MQGDLKNSLEMFSELGIEPSKDFVRRTMGYMFLNHQWGDLIEYSRHFDKKIPRRQILAEARDRLRRGSYYSAMNLFNALGKKPSRQDVLSGISKMDGQDDKLELFIQFKAWKQASQIIESVEILYNNNLNDAVKHPKLHAPLRRRARKRILQKEYASAANIYQALRDREGIKHLLVAISKLDGPEVQRFWRLDDVFYIAQKLRVALPKDWIRRLADIELEKRDDECSRSLYDLIKEHPPQALVSQKAECYTSAPVDEMQKHANWFAEIGDTQGMIACADRALENGYFPSAEDIYQKALRLLKTKKA